MGGGSRRRRRRKKDHKERSKAVGLNFPCPGLSLAVPQLPSLAMSREGEGTTVLAVLFHSFIPPLFTLGMELSVPPDLVRTPDDSQLSAARNENVRLCEKFMILFAQEVARREK